MAGEADGCVKAGGFGCLGIIGLIVVVTVGGILRDNAASRRVASGEASEGDLGQMCSTALVQSFAWSRAMRTVHGGDGVKIVSQGPPPRIQCVYFDDDGRPAAVTADIVCTRLTEPSCAHVVSVVTPSGRAILPDMPKRRRSTH